MAAGSRLFIAIWPPPAVRVLLASLPRPVHPAVRWSRAGQWHATVRFLGNVPDAAVSDLLAAVGDAANRIAPVPVSLGPVTSLLNPKVLIVPVVGLEDVAAAIAGATATFGDPVPARPFVGHLTVARARGHGRIPKTFAGISVAAVWRTETVALVRSHLDPGEARYETVEVFGLGSTTK